MCLRPLTKKVIFLWFVGAGAAMRLEGLLLIKVE